MFSFTCTKARGFLHQRKKGIEVANLVLVELVLEGLVGGAVAHAIKEIAVKLYGRYERPLR